MFEMFHSIPPNLFSFAGVFYGLKSQNNLKSSKIINNCNSVIAVPEWVYWLRKPFASFYFYLNLTIV